MTAFWAAWLHRYYIRVISLTGAGMGQGQSRSPALVMMPWLVLLEDCLKTVP